MAPIWLGSIGTRLREMLQSGTSMVWDNQGICFLFKKSKKKQYIRQPCSHVHQFNSNLPKTPTPPPTPKKKNPLKSCLHNKARSWEAPSLLPQLYTHSIIHPLGLYIYRIIYTTRPLLYNDIDEMNT